MIYEQSIVHKLYRKLLTLYPRTFHELLGESMEQTFHDLWNEKRQTRKGLFGFVIWTFIETILGIVRERLLLIGEGDIMRAILKTCGFSTLISFLIILPFMILEIVNRRHLSEEFPFMLFFVLWLNLFAISMILLPIMSASRARQQDRANPVRLQDSILLTNPRSAAIVSIVLFFVPGIFPIMDSLGWLSMDRFFNGPNPEVAYLPGQILSFSLILFPIAAGIVAGGPIVRALRVGGGLFTHRIHLIIVIIISLLFAVGLVSLIMDQWPCFMGVPLCD